jgi:O-antigen/teichoic acid export membrane protein
MSLIFPFCAGAAVAAPVIIPVIFGRQWTSAVPVYQVLCLVAALDASFHLPSIQLEILGLFRHKLILQACFGLCFGLGILFLAPRGGLLAVTWYYAFLQAVRTFGLHMLSARSLGVSMVSLLQSWAPGLVCAAAVAAILALARRPELHFALALPAVNLGILVALSAATVALVYRLFFRSTVYSQWMALFQR